MNHDQPDDQKFEVVEPSALQSIQAAEVNAQITTAKKFPRQLSSVKKDMLGFATLDQETAASCFYSLPRGGKNIQGPSVRLAEIAASCYCNLRAGSRVISTVTTGDSPHVVIQAIAHDLEKNVAVTIEKRRRIFSKKSNNGRIDEDDINLACNAGAAIAFRDAIFKVVPLALIKPVYEAAKKVAIGDAKTLKDRRASMVESFAKMGVDLKRILLLLQKKALEDIGLEDLETLIGLHTAIKDGATTIDEAFKVEVPADAPPVFGQDRKPEDPKAAIVKDKKKGKDTAPTPTFTSVQQVVDRLSKAKVSYDDFADYLVNQGVRVNIRDTSTGYDDLPVDLCEKLLKEPKHLDAIVKTYGSKA